MSASTMQHQHSPKNAPVLDRTKRELCGAVAAIRFFDDISGVVIAALRTGETVKGRIQDSGELEIGTQYRFLGRWGSHFKHGAQFEFSTWVLDTPATCQGVVKYLEKNAEYVGTSRARKLWDKFGPKAVEILRTEPWRVVDAGIMPEREALDAAKSLEANSKMEKVKIDLHGLFSGRGFPGSLNKAVEIKWGAKAAEIVRKNPFRLLVEELPGAGFKRCDKLYVDLGFNAASLKRQMLCVWDSIRQESTGSTWHPKDIAKRYTIKLVGHKLAKTDDAIRLGVRAGWLSTRTDWQGKIWIGERNKCENERRVAECVLALSQGKPCLWPMVGDLSEGGLTPHQLSTLAPILSAPLCILAGSPGTGKTFTAAAVIRWVVERYGASRVMVAAPTGKAAVRITEAMRKYEIPIQATTIHRALKIGRNGHDGKGWGFEFCDKNPLPHKFIFIDELSMLDTDLAAALFSACGPGTHLFLIGDPGQLAPVGHGCPQRDMILANVPHGILTEIKRNDGLIVQACAKIRAGREFETCLRYEPLTGQNLRWLEPLAPAPTSDNDHEPPPISPQIKTIIDVLEGVRRGEKFDAVWDTQVLCAMNTKGQCSREALNRVLQGMLNPMVETEEDRLARAERDYKDPAHEFRAKDKIICLKNCFLPLQKLQEGYAENVIESYVATQEPTYLANGEIGRVLATAPRSILVKFPEPDRHVIIPMQAQRAEDQEQDQKGNGDGGDKNDFALAYAITTHKCVHPDTLVETEEGLLPISEILHSGRISTPSGTAAYSDFVSYPANDALSFTMNGGYELTTTIEHKMEVWSGEQFVLQPANVVQCGDIMRLRLGVTTETSVHVMLPAIPDGDVRATIHKVPEYMSEEFAEFLGLMVADGTVWHGGFRLLKRHDDVAERFGHLCRLLFGVEPRKVYGTGAWGYEVSSTILSAWLTTIGGMQPNSKDVPECVLRSPSMFHWKFLRGLFEDGTVNIRDGNLADHIAWSTTSTPLLKKVRVMLLRAKIVAGTVETKHGWTLAIYSKCIGIFRDLIGFVAAFKNDRLKIFRETENRYFVPISNEERKFLRSSYPKEFGEFTSSNARDRGYISRETAGKLLNLHPEVEFLRERLDYHYSKVKTITPTWSDSRCVEVPGDHRFFQNGISAGNSQGSEWPLVIVVIDDAAGMVASREFHYTALSRASKLCLLVGKRATLAKQCRRVSLNARKTFLVEMLQEGAKKS